MAKLLLISALMNGVSGETANLRSQVIVVKGPPTSGGTPAQELAPICASGFNAAYAKCLGGTNSYLMIMVTDATKAYCAYTGGWAQNPENYPDYKACFPSPGQSEPLFYDSGKKTLSTWDEITVVTGLEQDFTSLSCTRPGANPCEATVQPSYARQLTKDGTLWQEVLPGEEFRFNWRPSDGYIGVVTIQPQQIYSMFVKDNLGVGSNSGLSADVPCAIAGSVEFQANNFPVKGLSGPCRKYFDDYWIAFGSGVVTICFPGVVC